MPNGKLIFYPRYYWDNSYAVNRSVQHNDWEESLYNRLDVEFLEVSVKSQGVKFSFFYFHLNITDKVEDIWIFKV